MIIPGPVQTSYTRYAAAGQAGSPASESGWDVDTKIVLTAAGIGFGLAVSQSLQFDRGVDLAGGSGGVFVGITARDITKFVLSQAGADKYGFRDQIPVAVRGDWWVRVEDDVDPTVDVTFDPTTGQLGASGGTVINIARWMQGATAGNLAVVRLGSSAGGSF